jgi:hypothetical protein
MFEYATIRFAVPVGKGPGIIIPEKTHIFESASETTNDASLVNLLNQLSVTRWEVIGCGLDSEIQVLLRRPL